MKGHYRKRLLRVWQLTVLIVSLGGLVFLLEYSARLSAQNTQILNNQNSVLSRLMIRQTANKVAQPIVDSDQQALELMIEQLSQEPLLLDATIYDIKGITLAKSVNATSLDHLLGLNTPLSIASHGRQQLVEPVLHDNTVVGFVRLTLEQADINAVASSHTEKLTNSIRGMVLGAVFLTLLLTITFGKRRDIRRFQYLLTANEK